MTAPSARPSLVSDEVVYNVALGSNMDAKKLRSRQMGGRPPIAPLAAGVPCTVPGWALSFDFLFLPPAEPVMAGAVARPGATLHGVLWKLSRADYDTLAHSEGCLSATSLYVEAAVDAFPYASAGSSNVPPGPVRATVFALRFPPPTFPRFLHPSRRYMDMLVGGARAARLDPAIVAALETHPVAREVHPRMRGFSRFTMIGLFFLYRSTRLMLLARHYYRPLIAAVYSRREAAYRDTRPHHSLAWTALMVAIMLPMAALGLARALYQRRDVLAIAGGKSA